MNKKLPAKNQINPSNATVGRHLRKYITQPSCFETNAQGHTTRRT
jgi:hypothetical protein